MNRQTKPPAGAAPLRKRKKAGADGAGAAAAAAGSSPPAAKKQRVSAPKARAGKEDAGEVQARDEPRGGGLEAADEARGSKAFGGLFSKDLALMMYAFGDADKPLKETVDLVEEVAMAFITDTVDAATRAAAARSTGAGSAGGRKDEVRLEDVLYAVRRDPRKVARAQELIRRQQEIDTARRVLKDDDPDMPTKM